MAEEKKVVVTDAAKAVAAKAPAKVEAAKAEAPKAEAKKPVAAKKPAAKKAAAKPAAKKAAQPVAKKAAAKPAAKKAAAKPAAKKEAAVKATVNYQFANQDYKEADFVKIAKDVWKYDLGRKVGDFKTVELYVKPEENKVYYVINGDVTGDFAI